MAHQLRPTKRTLLNIRPGPTAAQRDPLYVAGNEKLTVPCSG
jgi:hypothetical protein